MKKFIVSAFAVAAASAAFAGTFTFSEVAVSPSATATTWTFDTLFSLSPTTDDWTAGGVKAVTNASGVNWYYSNTDPNVAPTAPGTASPAKFSSFVNNPRSQFANGRFTSATSFAGSYSPATPTVIKSGSELNAAWLESPPVTTSLDTAAATVRLTLDTTNRPDITGVVVNGTGELLATVQVAAASTDNGGTLSLFNFTLNAVPEPASLAMLALGSLLGFRRR